MKTRRYTLADWSSLSKIVNCLGVTALSDMISSSVSVELVTDDKNLKIRRSLQEIVESE